MKSHPVSATALLLLSAVAAAIAWFAISSLKGAYYADGLLVRNLGPDVEPGVLLVHQALFWACVVFASLFCLGAVLLVDHMDVRRWWYAFPTAMVALGAVLGFMTLAAQDCGQYENVTQCIL